jgi:lipid II:glycine glycyltransferase (peptidoglycan interpeptide bridge formation enzyme)
LRIVKGRVLNPGFAYARWGPLWKRDGIDLQERRQNLCAMVQALAEEYSGKRNLILKVLPHVHEDDESKAEVKQAFKEQGFVKDRTFEDRTILIDLSRDLDILRANLQQGWRRNLKKAEKNHIEVTEGTQGEHLAVFRNLYGKMLRRKNYIPSVDLEQYIEMQKTLKRKMLTFIAHHDASPCSGAIVSFLGNTAIYLFGATDDRAIQLNASYLVHWKIMERLKEMGASWYDLNGANPERNPDMYRFKDGLGGKERREVSFIGRFDKYRKTIANRLLVKAFEMRKRLHGAPGDGNPGGAGLQRTGWGKGTTCGGNSL